ncbi:MAG: zinc ribbon domain-containing protein [Gemmatimonadota bacterium]|nr:zinc ribbon domain-containing protein [Gemmatimonadota bacterium]
MPIFDYKCEACGHTFDVLQKVGEGPLRKCPECGKLKLKKQLAAPNFHLKGSGWYKTDFKDGPAKKAPEGSPSKSTDKAETKADGDKKGHSLDTTPEKKPEHKHDHSHGPGGHKH